jgi:hypothetical protein
MNLFGILGILVVVAGNYGPDRYWFFALRVYLGLVADGCAMVAEAMRFRPHERPVKVSERFGERDAFARFLFDEASHAICSFLSLRIRYALCSKAC